MKNLNVVWVIVVISILHSVLMSCSNINTYTKEPVYEYTMIYRVHYSGSYTVTDTIISLNEIDYGVAYGSYIRTEKPSKMIIHTKAPIEIVSYTHITLNK